MGKKLDTATAKDRFKKLGETVAKQQEEVERTDIIPIEQIIFNKDNIFNIDDSEESIAELAKNIKENGLLHNIVVAEIEPKKYLLISGERRTKAVQSLGQDKIKATIKKNLSELDILKMLFFANSETREYSIEEKVQIIEGFLAKIKKFETSSEKESAARFREYVAQAFNVSERQAYKLIAITSELILPLKEMLFSDTINSNTAAALAQLPEECQRYAYDILQNSEDQKYAITQALDFAKRTKNIISKTNSALTKHKTSKMYYDTRLTQAKNELSEVESKVPETDEDKIELEEKKIKLNRNIATAKANLEELNRVIDVEAEKQDNEIKKVFTNIMYSVEKGCKEDKSGQIAQDKLIAREIQTIDNAVKKLLAMKPDEELNEIRNSLDKYRSKYET